ncbi:hypothetical protein HAX54_051016 [Datura stramonium]|uniref:Uncharacterized protein n=1 Tax=Datura stramonium TaxID=4076 RepID=A0ABS8RSQ2_DATST|nr:hypothetical protein [Datura stramonium]
MTKKKKCPLESSRNQLGTLSKCFREKLNGFDYYNPVPASDLPINPGNRSVSWKPARFPSSKDTPYPDDIVNELRHHRYLDRDEDGSQARGAGQSEGSSYMMGEDEDEDEDEGVAEVMFKGALG